ncbi:MAG: CpsD/CapB family tyrosine-protein kinase [Chloroflexaceae bacterium]|nr:CpsD/CapB family tyrosine-protein kinase [Chloroflexaceae bacterium]
MISSVAPSEGKSTVAVNLAKAAANMGQSVLLVDIDLRRPVLHERLGLENQTGLTNVLADGMPIEEIVQRVPHWENFFALTAGDVAPDPPRLLSSGRMKQVMEQLQGCGTYDLIVYDTPPMLAFADARIVAPATDGVILVVKINQTERTGFRQTLEQAKISRVPLLGVAVNGITGRGRGEYYYRYYYGKERKSAHKAQV